MGLGKVLGLVGGIATNKKMRNAVAGPLLGGDAKGITKFATTGIIGVLKKKKKKGEPEQAADQQMEAGGVPDFRVGEKAGFSSEWNRLKAMDERRAAREAARAKPVDDDEEDRALKARIARRRKLAGM
jgi:hypothetical protein